MIKIRAMRGGGGGCDTWYRPDITKEEIKSLLESQPARMFMA